MAKRRTDREALKDAERNRIQLQSFEEFKNRILEQQKALQKELRDERKDAVFYRTDPLLYHKFGNVLIFRSGNLYSLCSPGNQGYQKIIQF